MSVATPGDQPQGSDWSHMTYTWKVTGIKIKDEVNAEGVTLPKAICQTYWQKIGTDANGNEGTFSGATPFSAAEVFNSLVGSASASLVSKVVMVPSSEV